MRIKKAILTGGGRATRLYPITTTINKHLLPLANKPMIFHAIEKVVEAGVEEIFINVNPGDTELQKFIGDGGHWGIKIKFFEQTGGPQGIAHVVKEAEKFIDNDPFIFYLSDNIIFGSIKEMVDEFNSGNQDCMLALSKVPDPNRFGVPVFCEGGNLIDVLEKPENPPSDFAVTGIYLYGPKVFFKAFDNIEKSSRGEYEISSIHSHFLKNNYKVGHKEITGWWKDTGLADDLLLANKMLLERMEGSEFPNHGSIYESADISGNVRIGIGSVIGKSVKITGPAIIGENCVLENCEVGPFITIGSGTEVKDAKLRDNIILENCDINCDIQITDSLIGRGVKIVKKKTKEAEGHKMIVGDKTILEL
ncbi:MAG: glucose-1-phosphate thymidylyltransferase [Candidatus Magasanikbacteria bacterium]|jgi:glucose-1-phosphate thymidylyltransferase|nr:glucose-1-phosphate thymidylyltransferase [Candidatus Magasanikbacteria bacterium]MBT4314940.1 glucose-1-phosphate thymidylyltransferase [Candidatus Magasanikbacteria bacterium]MBT4546896.1 glucose-1-phosphate thymidylyltransferase [Candidatus Magasanikbacteria bacterium]MBT6819190.1 glucose-1-phosphate thymidylyltransferase [Candidatus Magasanikbacteria bacterium]